VNEYLRVAVIGCGLIGQWQHIPSLLRVRNVKLMAVCDENEDLARRVARAFGIGNYYTDFSKMLRTEKVNIVDICTPPQTHKDLTMRAIEAGCHVLVEKPIAFTLRELDEMDKAARLSNVKVCQIHNFLFEPVTIKACKAVSEGRIGDITGVDIQMLGSKSRDEPMLADKKHWCHSLPAGILTEMLPHPIYLTEAFLGKVEPVRIYTGKSRSYDWLIADDIKVVLKSRKGLGTISYSCNSAKNKVIIDIHGTRRHLRIDLWNSVMIGYGFGTKTRTSRALENLSQSFSILTNTAFTTLNVITGRFYSGHYTLISQFIQSIQNNTEPPVTFQQARDVIEVLEKITVQI
jgi:predicted dehydrogenase